MIFKWTLRPEFDKCRVMFIEIIVGENPNEMPGFLLKAELNAIISRDECSLISRTWANNNNLEAHWLYLP